MDFGYIVTKRTLERAAADVGLVVTAHNQRRSFTMLSAKHPQRVPEGFGVHF